MQFFSKKRGVSELLGSDFKLPELEPSIEPVLKDSEYKRLKNSIDSLKEKYGSLSKVEDRLERFASKHTEAFDAALKNQGAIEELKETVSDISENLNTSVKSLSQSVEKLKDIVLGLNDELCSLRKDFYSMTNKDSFNQFRAEMSEEIARFKGESTGLDRRLADFRRMALEQASSKREVEVELSRMKGIELDIKRVFKHLEELSLTTNDLKMNDAQFDGRLRNGMSAIKEELTIDEDMINKLILRNKEFLKIKDEMSDIDRRFKLIEKDMKNIGDDDLSMRDYIQKEFRMVRGEMSMVRFKVLEAMKRDEQMQAHIERLLPPKLDKEVGLYRQAVAETGKAIDSIKLDHDSFRKSFNNLSKDFEQYNRKLTEQSIILSNFVKSDEFKSGMDFVNMRLNQAMGISGQVESLKRHVDSGFERFDMLNKHIVDKMMEGEIGGSGRGFSRIQDELRQLEDAKKRLDSLSGPSRIDDSSLKPIFKWIEDQLNSGKSPRQVKQALSSKNMDPCFVDKYFASQ